MSADTNLLGQYRAPVLAGLPARPTGHGEKSKEPADEESCPAYGYLRGTHDRSLTIEFRLLTGDTVALPYQWLGPVRFNPSAGLLLRFTGDVVTLVLIRGSNLDAPVGTGSVNLTDRGLHRHRVTYVREMDAAELRKVGEAGPTVDGIEVAEFESQDELKKWVETHAPAFRPPARK